jgi:hypothetical protein
MASLTTTFNSHMPTMNFIKLRALATLSVLPLLFLTGCGESNAPQASIDTRPDASNASPTLAAAERPAAKPASAAEWSAVQKFIRDIWALSLKHSRLQDAQKADTARHTKALDLAGVLQVQRKYSAQLRKLIDELDRMHVPDVADKNADRYIAQAYGGYERLLLAEIDETNALIRGINYPDTMMSDEELKSRVDDLNRQTALATVARHRIYWTYGYQDSDFDPQTYALKKGSRPSATVSFNLGES